MRKFNRREFIQKAAASGAVLALESQLFSLSAESKIKKTVINSKPAVSIVKVKNDNVTYAVEKALDFLGGVSRITAGKERILLKPNLLSEDSRVVTKPSVIKALAQLMKKAGKDVVIGEGSAASKYNKASILSWGVCSTSDINILNRHQQYVFDELGYSDLARSLKVPLINLHTGDLAKVRLDDGFVFNEIVQHPAVIGADLICTVPMMKMHSLTEVTLGMKNLFGLFPGQYYGTVRSAIHKKAAEKDKTGTASAIVDIARAVKPGLTVIDATTALEGQGPSMNSGATLVKMDLIIAGTNPLATDMVGASVMGYQPEEISTFQWAWKAGMTPCSMNDIEIHGESLNSVTRKLKRPYVIPWKIMSTFGSPC